MALAAVLLGACSSDDDPGAAPSPTEQSPPPPEVQAIEPQVSVETRSLASGSVIDRSQAAPADDAAIAAMTDAVTAWLTRHLDGLQNGDGGALAELAAPGLLDAADVSLVDGATTGLTSPADPVRQATYQLHVGHDGAPRWVQARISVTRASGTVAEATFVFVPGEGQPLLIALEPRGGAA